jgi:hypothetical protein
MSSRDNPDLMTCEPVLVGKPIATYSLAGVQTKIVAYEAFRLACRCGWAVVGRIEDGAFVANRPPA